MHKWSLWWCRGGYCGKQCFLFLSRDPFTKPSSLTRYSTSWWNDWAPVAFCHWKLYDSGTRTNGLNYLLNSFISERSFLDVCVQLIPSPFIHLLLGSVSLSNQQLFLSSFNLLLSEAQMIQLGTMWWLITGLSLVSSAPHSRDGECTLWKARMWLAAEHTPTQQQVQVWFRNEPPGKLQAI